MRAGLPVAASMCLARLRSVSLRLAHSDLQNNDSERFLPVGIGPAIAFTSPHMALSFFIAFLWRSRRACWRGCRAGLAGRNSKPRPTRTIVIVLCVLTVALAPSASFGQTLFGVGLSASTLGIGAQGAVSVGTNADIRAGFNVFDYNDNFSKDGIHYSGELKLRSIQATYDQFFGGHFADFHISPGLLVYDGNSANASAAVPAGQAFTVGGVSYYSSTTNPVSGTGAVSLHKVAPMLLLGFGSTLPRSGRHFGFSIEGGVIVQGAPSTKLNLVGTPCLPGTDQIECAGIGAQHTFQFDYQANVQLEQAKLSNNLNWLKFYPVISLDFSFKF